MLQVQRSYEDYARQYQAAARASITGSVFQLWDKEDIHN